MDEGIVRIFHTQEIAGPHTRIIGRRIYKYDTIGSTNDAAFMYGLKGEKEGAVFWARAQTKGRGRLGRSWVSHKDKGLYFSVLLCPRAKVKDAAKITLLAGMSMVKALRGLSGLGFLIKWPNDIVIDDKKIGGILTEMDAEVNRVKFIAVGIGINTNLRKSELPVKEAVSLRVLLQKEISQESVFNACLKEFDGYYCRFKNGGFPDIIDEARHFSSLWGKQVKINGREAGVAVDFDDQGALVVRQDNGFRKAIFAGDVELLR